MASTNPSNSHHFLMSCLPCTRRSIPKRHIRLFSQEELESATSGFSHSALLGRGSHGSVFLAALDNGRLLAAAKLPAPPPFQDPTTSPSSFTANEIAVLSSLPSSPLLVNLLGRSAAAPIAIVEFMPNGSLHDLIHSPLPRPPSPFSLRLRLALRSATAVAYLHALHPPVIHRDIKPSNILLDAGGNARLADFGLAVRGLPSGSAPAGTIGYLDPAYLSPGDLSAKTDVYSFGVVLLELVSGRRAIDVEYSPVSVVRWAVRLVEAGRFEGLWDPRGGGPGSSAEEAAARDVARMAARCVVSAPQGRPSMEEVVACLRSAGRRCGCSVDGKCLWRSGRRRKVANVAAEVWLE